jgi:hypothetical protein
MTSQLSSRCYFFILQGPNRHQGDSFGSLLSSDADALSLAHRIVRELKDGGGYSDPGLKVIVKNADDDVIHIVPF